MCLIDRVLGGRSPMSLRNGAKRMATETSRGAAWASWMDDRTTTAYSPRAHAFMPRPAAASLSEGRMLRAAPPATVSARARADDAGLMWLDDADLLSVSEPSAPAAESGSI